ncbi:conserved hypothetical protein [Talaromyces stipitatus ATCC 10500]|uniref:Uncharacterized protein n=1 Tax=Talaromyces stipitatus (strain ATCC 10500 / CBS 375.48 / QM 6759 / NRRL 1006) TaxID=441959 RepID=B8M2H1_TALSN|nr:uncharacterized protein TSTA_088710 [Talaromyces stipitatus ATCC 10500]EED21635.1 conserved hypothetical protein [Talaromyces stipitatus ATCC 10500]
MNPSTDDTSAPPPPYDLSSSSNNFNRDKKTSSAQKSPQNISSPSRTELACVSLHMSDRIRLLNFRPEHVRIITDVIRANTVKGVPQVRLYDQATEIKLGGYPWMRGGTRPLPEDRIGAIRVIIAVLKTCYDLGWVVQLASDIWRKGSLDKDTVIMRYTHQPQRPTSHWLGISFDSSDLLNIINAPPSLGPAIAARFGDKVSSHKVETRGYYEIKFHGYPWRPSGTGCDTWYCCRDADYVEGTAVY